MDAPEQVRRGVELAPFTTWSIGGPAEWFAEPTDEASLLDLLGWAAAWGIPVSVLGRGSNVLIADAGVPGLTVLLRRGLRDRTIDAASGLVAVGAGATLPRLAVKAGEAGIGGFESFVAIPGSVGGDSP